jgi:ribosomal protein S27AE
MPARNRTRTPNNAIRKKLYQLFLYSRERAFFMKNKNCEKCGSTVKMQCHHDQGIDWGRIIIVVREELLNAEKFKALCKDCHGKVAEKGAPE